eukprot:symbB.v1.2.022316.t1/scaffold1975.1/size94033/3
MKHLTLVALFFTPAALKLNFNANEVGHPSKTNSFNSTAELSQLIHAVQDADRHAAKQVLADIVRDGGEPQMQDVLGRFAAMGYDYNVLLRWVSGALTLTGEAAQAIHTKQTAAHPEHPIPPVKTVKIMKAFPKVSKEEEAAEVGFKFLLRGLDTSNETLVKDAFAQMLQNGGKAFLSSKLLEVQKMGYDIEAIKRWYSSKQIKQSLRPEITQPNKVNSKQMPQMMRESTLHDSESMSQSLNNASKSSEAKEIIELMKAENHAGMKEKITEIFTTGGEPKIKSVLAAVQAMGYDPADVELVAAGKKRKHKEQKSQKVNKEKQEKEKEQKEQKKQDKKVENEKKENDKDVADEALSLLKSIAGGDRDGARKQLGYVWSKGGQDELQEVLQRVQFAGHDAAQIQAWVAESGDSNKTKSEIQSHGLKIQPKPPKAASVPVPKMAPSETLSADAELLVTKLRAADRKAAADAIIQMFQSGGQLRIQKALATLKLWGYDPKRFQRWVAAGVPGLLILDTETPEPKSSPKSPKSSPAEDRKALMAMTEALKHWNRTEATQVLSSVLQKSGPIKVEELFAELQALGYDPTDVQAWLSTRTTSTPDLTALSAEKRVKGSKGVEGVSAKTAVKLLGVQDFRIAVSDLSTARLTNA